jgi:N-formylglutamate amidohydrolase
MPCLARAGDRPAPDVVLGDRYGTACAPAIIDLVETVFSGAGLKVARNRPYAGGYCTRTYGRPQHGLHAVQIEIGRHLYMNEVTLAKSDGFAAMRQLAERLIFALVDLDCSALSRTMPLATQTAAE